MQKDNQNKVKLVTISQIKAEPVRVDMNHKIPTKLSSFFDLKRFRTNLKLDEITEEEENNPIKPTVTI